jgi:hypothetical protein
MALQDVTIDFGGVTGREGLRHTQAHFTRLISCVSTTSTGKSAERI